MNIQERLEAATAKAEAASAILHQVANGAADVEVEVLGGVVPSLLKWFATLNDATESAAAALIELLPDVAKSGDYTDLDNIPSTFPPSSHGHGAGDVSGLATVATSGSYNDLINKPPLGAMAARGEATTTNIRAFSGDGGITGAGLAAASALVAFAGNTDLAPSWPGFVIGDWVDMEGELELKPATDVIPGVSRCIFLRGKNGTPATLTFDSSVYKGDLPVLEDITDTQWYLLTLIPHSATHIVVTCMDASP